MSILNELRMRYLILSFLTDKEIWNLLTVVESVSIGTSVEMEEILEYLDQESDFSIGTC